MTRSRYQTLTVKDNIDINHNINITNDTVDTPIEQIVEETIPEPKIEEPKMEPVRNLLEIILNDSPIEIVNLATGYTSSIVPKINGKLKLANSNLYRIAITNNSLNADNFYVIKQYSKYSEFFRIVAVSNGRASIVPILSGLELKSGDVIGELI